MSAKPGRRDKGSATSMGTAPAIAERSLVRTLAGIGKWVVPRVRNFLMTLLRVDLDCCRGSVKVNSVAPAQLPRSPRDHATCSVALREFSVLWQLADWDCCVRLRQYTIS